MSYLGDFPVGATVQWHWNTNAQTGASITPDDNGTLKIYKDGSTTARSSLAGVTQTADFASNEGDHYGAVDCSDNTHAGFYAAGHEYFATKTVMDIDGQTVNYTIAHWSIERAGGIIALLRNVATKKNVGVIFEGTVAASPTPTAAGFKISGSDVLNQDELSGMDTQVTITGHPIPGRALIDTSSTAAGAVLAFKSNLPAAPIAGDAVQIIGTPTGTVDANVVSMEDETITATVFQDASIPGSALATSFLTKIFTTAFTEAYRANGAAPTLAQALCELLARLSEISVSGTTATIKKFDHSTTAMTDTLNSSTVPTAVTRAT